MNIIAIRYGEHFAPECGTIAAHQEIIDRLGYVWYGKIGETVTAQMIEEIKKRDESNILLINSGKTDRYWAHISKVSQEQPPIGEFLPYYKEQTEKVKTWFKVNLFELEPRDVMAQCTVICSGSPLSEASKNNLGPYFKIRYDEEEKC